MRIMAYRQDGVEGLAVSSDGSDWCGMRSDHPRFPGGLVDALGDAVRLQKLITRLQEGAPVDPAQVMILTPVPVTGKVLCIGLNYADHVAETGLPTPTDLTVFTRFASSFVAHGEPLIRPLASEQFDYEAELGVVIGAPARHVGRDTALRHVAGYTLINDGSIRDAQMRSSQWTLGKNYDATGSIGPWIVTADALPEGGTGLRITGRLNDEIVQDGDTSDMVFGVARIIELLSAVMTLNPGDIIATGTPAGVAMGQARPRWLRTGDHFEVSVEGIGSLSNPVIDESV